jgi:putative membrane protein
MVIRWLVAAIHLLALALGMTAIWMRGSAFSALSVRGASPADRVSSHDHALAALFRADNAWAAAAALWLATGLPRAFAGLEKGTAFYLSSTTFWIKMALFALVFALEVFPMVTLIRWRMHAKRGEPIDLGRAPLLATISRVQAALLVLIVLAATAMARGLGL